MKARTYKVKHHYQPTSNTCGYAALATLLSYYRMDVSPMELVSKVTQPKDTEGTTHGSVTAQLVEWCQTQGVQTHMYASDCVLLDLSWQNFSSEKLIERLRAIREVRDVLALGKHWSKVYVDAYIDMLSKGSKLSIVPFITTELLHKLLDDGPVYVNVCSTALGGKGRSINTVGGNSRNTNVDDVNGMVYTHSIVIYGNDEAGDYVVSDPWDGLVVVKAETMVCAIEAAQIECDNQCFVIAR